MESWYWVFWIIEVKDLVESDLISEIIFFVMFIYLFWEGERARAHTHASGGGAERERERERIFSRLHAQCRARCGTRSHNPQIMTWAKIKSRMPNWATHMPQYQEFLNGDLWDNYELASEEGSMKPQNCMPIFFIFTRKQKSIAVPRFWKESVALKIIRTTI